VFTCGGQHVSSKGFTSIMPWLAVSEKNLPQFKKGEKISIAKVDLNEVINYYIC
jgi:DNA topoisomerase III